MYHVVATCPTRIDLAGGTLDLWPIYLCLQKKATVNIGVTLNATASLSFSNNDQFVLISEDQGKRVQGNYRDIIAEPSVLPLHAVFLREFWDSKFPPIRLHTKALSPAGAGLGGSSCLAVCILAAILQMRSAIGVGIDYTERDLVNWVQNCEAQLIKTPPGSQDYWGGVRGGINLIHYSSSQVKVTTLKQQYLPDLSKWLLVCYSGISRFSGINNWQVFKKFFDQNLHTIKALEEIGFCAERCADSIQTGDTEKALQASFDEWQIRRSMWPDVETEETMAIDMACRRSGAWFTRVCGAGGGGAMLIVAPFDKHEQIKTAAEQAGGKILPALLSENGLEIRVEKTN